VAWSVVLSDAFEVEFFALDIQVQNEILASAKLLETYGPALGRPFVDTLKGSTYRNMKELRLTVRRGEWRVAFAFAPDRRAVVLCAADKRGLSQTLFYNRLIAKADQRLKAYLGDLENLKKAERRGKNP
jgi:hypothetical protein